MFAEGKVVPEKLAELVGAAAVSSAPERYGLSYAGRTEALREMLAPSTGTLRPDRNTHEEGELRRDGTIRNSRIVQIDGDREVSREVEFYNLDVIISVGATG